MRWNNSFSGRCNFIVWIASIFASSTPNSFFRTVDLIQNPENSRGSTSERWRGEYDTVMSTLKKLWELGCGNPFKARENLFVPQFPENRPLASAPGGYIILLYSTRYWAGWNYQNQVKKNKIAQFQGGPGKETEEAIGCLKMKALSFREGHIASSLVEGNRFSIKLKRKEYDSWDKQSSRVLRC